MTKDSLPSQSTTLEALLRGEGLDRRNNSKNDEESLLEIQVRSVRRGPKARPAAWVKRWRSAQTGPHCQVYPADLQGSLAQCSLEFSFTDGRCIIAAIKSSAVTTRTTAMVTAGLHLRFILFHPVSRHFYNHLCEPYSQRNV